ncbi:MAG: nuclear transport factor 2 family protein [Chloroflexi bacterium]|nr:nuclear transport factor 2 family protein [Chloroflexota bacterium]
MQPLTHGEGQDLLERFKQAWERRDPDLAMELYREDAEHRDHPFREPFRGANEIRAMWNDIVLNEAHVEFDAERTWVNGSTVLASYHAAYTDRTTGERVRMRGFMTIEVDGEGHVSRLREWPTTQVVGMDTTLRPDRQPGLAGDEPIDPNRRRTHGR